ncbi:MAG: glutamate--tRNA ligase [Hydrogenophilaceae bacterium]|jgi:glutamyl-tRNA synthetase|nr:glutamate--tRNA ligase [Hydrogenophilaceae bacterium]
MKVVTRFAPSPTGFLHIGGARTALFNWLFARRHGGKYLLRIEDTDRARSTQAAIDAIIEGLEWLGVTPDEPPIFQFARAARHAEIAHAMIARGTAFRCYLTPEEVEARRAEAHAEGRALRSPYRTGEVPATDLPFVVRLKAPDEGEIVNDDLIQGPVRIRARDIDDLVLLRADGTPTYMLAVVVDDHDMGITHVIRGDDHLTNAARQIAIYRAMGWTAPAFAHVPLIHGADGAKLSKRHGALGAEAYRDMGYLPEALAAYLIRLGWSPGHDDILTKEEAAAIFDLARVVKSPARLDLEKLNSVNAHFIREADDARLAALTLDYIAAHRDWPLTAAHRRQLAAAIPILKQRSKTIAEIADFSFFFIRPRPFELDAAAQKAMDAAASERLERLLPRLAAQTDWTAPALAAALKAFAEEEGIGLGKIGPPLRAALTGGAPAPDLGWTLEILGREETLARLADRIGERST